MTVIDYLPVGEEVRPNVLLSQTKKCIISKVMACITVFLLQVHLDKQRNNSAVIQLAVSALTTVLAVFLLWLCFCDGLLHSGVPLRAVHMTWGLFVWCSTISIATAITPGSRDSVPETTGLTRCSDIFQCTFQFTLYNCIHFPAALS